MPELSVVHSLTGVAPVRDPRAGAFTPTTPGHSDTADNIAVSISAKDERTFPIDATVIARIIG